ncbi:hypothetical protein [Ornithinimicrobium murale]|uniref:hypothetical protein n=1 Tax=Ornithinimicrobium murale TaxID=1050153 RepID=UPI000E0DB034|nr:hypothetical protein [Ornithinimicrobium murale]
MHILLDTPPETHAVARPVAIWPIVALTVAALIGLAAGTAATTDTPDSRENHRTVVTTVSQAV